MVSPLTISVTLLFLIPFSAEDHCSSAVMMPISGVKPHNMYPSIRFSSVSSHALHDKERQLCSHDKQDFHQCVRLHSDGWIRGQHGQLLLWVPSTMAKPFYSMCTGLIIPPGCVELDLSQMAHGSKWQECFGSWQCCAVMVCCCFLLLYYAPLCLGHLSLLTIKS